MPSEERSLSSPPKWRELFSFVYQFIWWMFFSKDDMAKSWGPPGMERSPLTNAHTPRVAAGVSLASTSRGPKKARFTTNYASNLLGAGITSAPSSCQSANDVLSKSRDVYMLCPCDTPRKELVVQLIRDVTVQQLMLENAEYFSSNIHEFRLLGSRSYPTKAWVLLGRFEAKKQLGKQYFHHFQPHWPVRFIKLQWISSHGEKPWCTLTSLAVYGVDALESLATKYDEEEEEELEEQREEEAQHMKAEKRKREDDEEGALHRFLNGSHHWSTTSSLDDFMSGDAMTAAPWPEGRDQNKRSDRFRSVGSTGKDSEKSTPPNTTPEGRDKVFEEEDGEEGFLRWLHRAEEELEEFLQLGDSEEAERFTLSFLSANANDNEPHSTLPTTTALRPDVHTWKENNEIMETSDTSMDVAIEKWWKSWKEEAERSGKISSQSSSGTTASFPTKKDDTSQEEEAILPPLVDLVPLVIPRESTVEEEKEKQEEAKARHEVQQSASFIETPATIPPMTPSATSPTTTTLSSLRCTLCALDSSMMSLKRIVSRRDEARMKEDELHDDVEEEVECDWCETGQEGMRPDEDEEVDEVEAALKAACEERYRQRLEEAIQRRPSHSFYISCPSSFSDYRYGCDDDDGGEEVEPSPPFSTYASLASRESSKDYYLNASEAEGEVEEIKEEDIGYTPRHFRDYLRGGGGWLGTAHRHRSHVKDRKRFDPDEVEGASGRSCPFSSCQEEATTGTEIGFRGEPRWSTTVYLSPSLQEHPPTLEGETMPLVWGEDPAIEMQYLEEACTRGTCWWIPSYSCRAEAAARKRHLTSKRVPPPDGDHRPLHVTSTSAVGPEAILQDTTSSSPVEPDEKMSMEEKERAKEHAAGAREVLVEDAPARRAATTLSRTNKPTTEEMTTNTSNETPRPSSTSSASSSLSSKPPPLIAALRQLVQQQASGGKSTGLNQAQEGEIREELQKTKAFLHILASHYRESNAAQAEQTKKLLALEKQWLSLQQTVRRLRVQMVEEEQTIQHLLLVQHQQQQQLREDEARRRRRLQRVREEANGSRSWWWRRWLWGGAGGSRSTMKPEAVRDREWGSEVDEEEETSMLLAFSRALGGGGNAVPLSIVVIFGTFLWLFSVCCSAAVFLWLVSYASPSSSWPSLWVSPLVRMILSAGWWRRKKRGSGSSTKSITTTVPKSVETHDAAPPLSRGNHSKGREESTGRTRYPTVHLTPPAVPSISTPTTTLHALEHGIDDQNEEGANVSVEVPRSPSPHTVPSPAPMVPTTSTTSSSLGTSLQLDSFLLGRETSLFTTPPEKDIHFSEKEKGAAHPTPYGIPSGRASPFTLFPSSSPVVLSSSGTSVTELPATATHLSSAATDSTTSSPGSSLVLYRLFMAISSPEDENEEELEEAERAVPERALQPSLSASSMPSPAVVENSEKEATTVPQEEPLHHASLLPSQPVSSRETTPTTTARTRIDPPDTDLCRLPASQEETTDETPEPCEVGGLTRYWEGHDPTKEERDTMEKEREARKEKMRPSALQGIPSVWPSSASSADHFPASTAVRSTTPREPLPQEEKNNRRWRPSGGRFERKPIDVGSVEEEHAVMQHESDCLLIPPGHSKETKRHHHIRKDRDEEEDVVQRTPQGEEKEGDDPLQEGSGPRRESREEDRLGQRPTRSRTSSSRTEDALSSAPLPVESGEEKKDERTTREKESIKEELFLHPQALMDSSFHVIEPDEEEELSDAWDTQGSPTAEMVLRMLGLSSSCRFTEKNN